MLHVLLARDFKIARGDPISSWPVTDQRLLTAGARIVFDDERALKSVLRDLCARDIEPIEVLDIDKHRYGFVMYNSRVIRRALKTARIQCMTPWIQWVSSTWALQLIGELAHDPRS